MSTTTSSTRSVGGPSPVPVGPQQGSVPAAPPAASAPLARTRRRPAMIGLAVLLIVGCAAVAGLLAVRLDTRSPALVAARPISVGQQITADDLAVQRISGDGLTVLGGDQLEKVVGSYATQNIPAGRLLDGAMVQPRGFLGPGTVAVGVTLAAGRMPASGLLSGDKVQVVQVQDGQASVLAGEAVVSTGTDTSSGSNGQFLGGGGGSSSGAVATLIVSPDVAPKIAAASAAGRVALVLISRGEGTTGR